MEEQAQKQNPNAQTDEQNISEQDALLSIEIIKRAKSFKQKFESVKKQLGKSVEQNGVSAQEERS